MKFLKIIVEKIVGKNIEEPEGLAYVGVIEQSE